MEVCATTLFGCPAVLFMDGGRRWPILLPEVITDGGLRWMVDMAKTQLMETK